MAWTDSVPGVAEHKQGYGKYAEQQLDTKDHPSEEVKALSPTAGDSRLMELSKAVGMGRPLCSRLGET
jgi:hypothetical protein